MGKMFGLFIFINFFLVGIVIGSRKKRFTLKTVGGAFMWFLGVYIVMGLILRVNVSFVLPK